MAGGKLSPRQRMINLMYLVFIAMMALNMGKEVLSAFGSVNAKLTESNKRITDKNIIAYKDLETKALEQAKQFGEAKEKTDLLRTKANEYYSYLEDLKTKMTEDVKDATDYEKMDKSKFLDEYFFRGGSITNEGKEFIAKMDEFRNSAVEILGKRELADVVASRFSTKPVLNRDKKEIDWLNYNYERFPLIASLAKITQIQADIRNTESDALSALLQKELSEAVSMSNYDAIVIFEKSAYYPGEKLSGKIVLGKNDPNLMAEKVVINGVEWPKDKIKAGQVILDGSAGGVGDKEIKGTFTFMEDGEPIDIPIQGGYSVIPKPNEAVISADKMNVVYKGLANPLTISIPGVPDNKVVASAPGLNRVKGNNYTMNPQGTGNVTIRVSGTLPNGGKVSSSKQFRIKDIPPASGMIRNQSGTVSMPKSSLAGVTVGAGLPGFLFDLKVNVSGFSVKVPGEVAVRVSGTRMNARAKQAISKARRGDQVTIFDIKGSVSGSSYGINKILPVIIKITN